MDGVVDVATLGLVFGIQSEVEALDALDLALGIKMDVFAEANTGVVGMVLRAAVGDVLSEETVFEAPASVLVVVGTNWG